jgi:hypothetical protein
MRHAFGNANGDGAHGYTYSYGNTFANAHLLRGRRRTDNNPLRFE